MLVTSTTSSNRVNDLRLIVVGAPRIRNGIVKRGFRAGQAYSVVEFKAFQKNFRRNSDGVIQGQDPATFFKLAVWGSGSDSCALAQKLCPRMQVTVSGVQIQSTFVGKDGLQHVANRINVESVGVDVPQIGLNTFDFDHNSVPQDFSLAAEIFNNSTILHAAGCQALNDAEQHAIKLRVLTAKALENGVQLTACSLERENEPDFYSLNVPMPKANAQAVVARLQPGMAIRVSGHFQTSAFCCAQEQKFALFEGRVSNVSVDLQQAELKGIDFEVNPRVYGIPIDFKGDPEDFFYGRCSASLGRSKERGSEK